jgi:hypothetical protein
MMNFATAVTTWDEAQFISVMETSPQSAANAFVAIIDVPSAAAATWRAIFLLMILSFLFINMSPFSGSAYSATLMNITAAARCAGPARERVPAYV